MKAGRAIRRWFEQRFGPFAGSARYHELIEQLHENEAAEDRRYAWVCNPNGQPDDGGPSVLAIREQRVDILRALGWHDQANAQETDNAMRRKRIEEEA